MTKVSSVKESEDHVLIHPTAIEGPNVAMSAGLIPDYIVHNQHVRSGRSIVSDLLIFCFLNPGFLIGITVLWWKRDFSLFLA